MQIDYLANWPGLIPELAALLYQKWADLYQAAGIDQAQLLLTGANTCSTATAAHFWQPVAVTTLTGLYCLC